MEIGVEAAMEIGGGRAGEGKLLCVRVAAQWAN